MKRYGHTEPRIFTPPLHELEPRTPEAEHWTLGYSVVDFATDVLRMRLFPWQRWLLIHLLELLADGSFRFRTVVILIARQNGKSTLSQVVALWFMYVFGADLVIGTAQDLDVAEEIWQGAVDMVEETPELDELKLRVVKGAGKKALELTTGQRYKVKAANRRGGRGLTGDLILLDELREHQSWDSWAAITKTTMARALAMVLALSNAGDASSIVLRYLRMMAHQVLGDPDGINEKGLTPDVVPDDEDLAVDDEDSLAIFEWSAPPGCPVEDRDGWAMANPSLGYTIQERTIAAAQRTDPEWVFRTEVLCQWRSTAAGGPFPDGAWVAGIDNDSEIAPHSPLAVCADQSADGLMVWVALAAFRPDGDIHVEMAAMRAGTDWLIPWLTATTDQDGQPRTWGAVTFQANGAPISSLKDAFAVSGLPVVEWAGADLARASGAFWELVRLPNEGEEKRRVFHLAAPGLDVAASQAVTKQLGDAWVIDRRRSPVDAAPLIAATGAAWVLGQIKVPKAAPTVHEWPEALLQEAGL